MKRFPPPATTYVPPMLTGKAVELLRLLRDNGDTGLSPDIKDALTMAIAALICDKFFQRGG